jgi:hypothetical protein
MNLTIKNILLPLLVLGFVGVAVTFLSPVFTTTTRWGLLLLCLLYVLVSGFWIKPFRSSFGSLTILFGLWALATALWSEVPGLTFMKGVAFLLVVVACLAIGQWWSQEHEMDKALDYLLPLTLAAILAGLLGRFSTYAVVHSGGTTLYQGLVSGPNMFGSMLAMCMPVLFWKTWLNLGNGKKAWFWMILVGIAAWYLFLASSRGAILIVFITFLGMMFSMSQGKRMRWALLTLAFLINAFLVVPGQFEYFQQQYIFKNATREQGVLHTREEVWSVSYQQAVKGGWFGGGFGVTIGAPNTYKGGLTAVGYGREKGNTQLALFEETGVVGFLIYLASLFALFHRLIRVWFSLPRGQDKTLLGIVTGVLAGMIVGSVFEAWWVAPGSPEAVYFWCLAGVGLGLAQRMISERAGEQATSMDAGGWTQADDVAVVRSNFHMNIG